MTVDARDPAESERGGRKAPSDSSNGTVGELLRVLRDWEVPVVHVDRVAKPCNECGALTYYKERTGRRPYGWRLCWRHLSREALVVA
jgi:hypothetical protein